MKKCMTNPFQIRAETPADRAAVATVLARSYQADGAAAIALACRLRTQPAFNPQLALVGLVDNKIVACATLTPVTVGAHPEAALMLAPVALDPQHPDVTPALWVEALLAEVARQPYRYVLVQGDPAVYQPHQFVAATTLSVTGEADAEQSVLMVKDLHPHQPAALRGRIEYPQ